MRKIAFLSNITIDFIVQRLKKHYDVYLPSGFDVWQLEIMNNSSELNKQSFDAIVILLHLDRYSKLIESQKEVHKTLNDWINTISILVQKFPDTKIMVSTIDLQTDSCTTLRKENYLSECESMWDNSVLGISSNVYLYGLRNLAREHGNKNFYSRKNWYIGSMPFSLAGIRDITQMIERALIPVEEKKKCIVLDLDNTLWGGVIGEDTVVGIELGEHKEGARYYDFQKCLLKMKNLGVMLAVISKNNPDDVKDVFNHPYMILKENDFVSLKINWTSKSENIIQLAQELNIGLDSMVFIDDNPAEREQMKVLCPEITVPDVPVDSAELSILAEKIYGTYFQVLNITDEDKKKTDQYIKRAKREELRQSLGTLEDYLSSLEIEVDIHLMKDVEKQRVVQLVGKTNQFNCTTIRYSEQEITKLQQKDSLIVATMKDKFGDEGLTAVLVIDKHESITCIESFLMSCRVMNRQFEDVIFSEVVRWIKNTNPSIKSIMAKYIKTSKNVPVEKLYDHLGFTCIEDKDNEKLYKYDVVGFIPFENKYKRIIAFEE